MTPSQQINRDDPPQLPRVFQMRPPPTPEILRIVRSTVEERCLPEAIEIFTLPNLHGSFTVRLDLKLTHLKPDRDAMRILAQELSLLSGFDIEIHTVVTQNPIPSQKEVVADADSSPVSSAQSLAGYRLISLRAPLTNPLEQIPPEILASFTLRAILTPRQATGESLDAAALESTVASKTETHLGAPHSVITPLGTGFIIQFPHAEIWQKLDELHGLSEQLASALPSGTPVVFVATPLLVSNDIVTFDPMLHVNDGYEGHHRFDLTYPTAQLLKILGTSEPWVVSRCGLSGKITLSIFGRNNESFRESCARISSSISNYLPIKHIELNRLTFDANTTLVHTATRPSLAAHELAKIRELVLDRVPKVLLSSVSTKGNVVVVTPSCPLPEECIATIAQHLRAIPCPIVIADRIDAERSVSKKHLQAILTLALPSSAQFTIRNKVLEESNHSTSRLTEDKIKVEYECEVFCLKEDVPAIAALCNRILALPLPQNLYFIYTPLPENLSEMLRDFPPAFHRSLFSVLSSEGDIKLNEYGISPDSIQLARSSSHRESKSAPSLSPIFEALLVDRTHDLSPFTIDGDKARFFEDAISIQFISQDQFILGIHLANTPLRCPQFSPERHDAYEIGSAIYGPDKLVMRLLPFSSRVSLREGEVQPVVSVYTVFSRDESGIWSFSRDTSVVSFDKISVLSNLSVAHAPPSSSSTSSTGQPLQRSRRLALTAAKVLASDGKYFGDIVSLSRSELLKSVPDFINHANKVLSRELAASNLAKLGIDTTTTFNASGRKIRSFVNLHQLNAMHELLEPLSESELTEIVGLESFTTHDFGKIRDALGFFELVTELRRTCNTPRDAVISGVVRNSEGNFLQVSVQVLRQTITGLLSEISTHASEGDHTSLVRGASVKVLPLRYSVESATWHFVMASSGRMPGE